MALSGQGVEIPDEPQDARDAHHDRNLEVVRAWLAGGGDADQDQAWMSPLATVLDASRCWGVDPRQQIRVLELLLAAGADLGLPRNTRAYSLAYSRQNCRSRSSASSWSSGSAAGCLTSTPARHLRVARRTIKY